MLDCTLNFSDNVDLIFKKANQRLFLLWKLGESSTSQVVLQRLHTSFKKKLQKWQVKSKDQAKVSRSIK